MLTQNLFTIVALALSVSAFPHNPRTYESSDLSVTGTVPVPDHRDATIHASAPDLTSTPPDLTAASPVGVLPTGAPGGPLPTGVQGVPGRPLPGPSPVPRPSTVQVSGGDGEGNQEVGNGGQNAVNGASNGGRIDGDYTVEQATTTCGNAQLNCCNKVSKKGDTTNAGLLGAVFGSGDLGVQCSPINIPVIGIQVPINKACDAKAACCQGDTVQNGLVNVGCIALASLI